MSECMFFLHISSGVFDEQGLKAVNHAVYKTGAAMLGRRLFCAAAPFEKAGRDGRRGKGVFLPHHGFMISFIGCLGWIPLPDYLSLNCCMVG